MNLTLVKEKITGSFPLGGRRSGAERSAESPQYPLAARPPLEGNYHHSKERFKLPKAVQTAAEAIYAMLKGLTLICRMTIGMVFYYLRRHPIHAIFNVLILIGVTALVITGAELHQQLILSKISNDTISNIIAGSDFTRQYDIDGARRNGVREFVATGAPKWTQSEGVKAILFEARKAELPIEDQAVLLAIANIESGFNPAAQAGITTACGLFQFVEKTGEMFNLKPNDCMDPWLNARAGVRHYIANYENRVRAKVNHLHGVERVFRTFELSYYLHHDGPASSNPSNELKAIVLNGTQFLFKAYHALQEESESHKHAPGFGQTFFENTVKTLNTIKESFSTAAISNGRVQLAFQKR